ncbi:putative uncharacterized protein [Tetragenococcus halophilus subsp. halophilus]|uniref:Membrane protein 6-pyruvoyl-tetrahydropterin synthase-related domain-containing protein n=1 Tax=Tetragenococcus halophilus (strain DSM 20338 / JCM 20259 / NCIMB 9735 / NBRC 12172) TaxID=945021 RepID=A0AAN1VRC9_TETHN|nr:hypothetical protein [Tetragenococcus halophilus]RQD32979.1 hypothetical protein C7K42_03290 [Tetragenococcus halophilus subsp. halophilus DSM 20339]BAK94955.1 hypothetical protein TEH_16280 [Tetragenococcus halophilus NBRC 12172]GBD59986.1 putative uncharacterized protein [Tetragenococcus halophilus subsp. halophilus]GBD71635.1 putative uncharacterized protein [Tetragenococcus halophilus subsp. halophilus]GBD82786.1 putative uncharacterized protein [Tetragenococcus halophilus subsp. haloph
MKKSLSASKKRIFISLMIIFIASILLQWVQISNQNLYLGYDWIFHYNRFYDTAQQIKEGNFHYFISMYGFSQSGRIINALYGPMFAYFNGLLLLICRSWFNYQLLTNFLITFLSAISMFTLLIKNKVRALICLIFSIMYSSFYIIQSWSFDQTLRSWGAIVLPLVVLAATRFLRESYSKKDLAFLAFVMTLAIQIHVLTVLFSVIILIPFFVFGFLHSKNKKTLFMYTFIAALATIFMTANVWYPLLEVNMENQLMRPFVVWNMENHALRLDLIRPYKDLSLVVCLLFVVQFFIIIYRKMSKTNLLATITAFMWFALSTKVFPWNDFVNRFPSISIIQFPSRLLPPAVVLIILALSLSIETISSSEKRKIDSRILIYPFLLLMLIGAVRNHIDFSKEREEIWQTELFNSTNNVIFATKDSNTLEKAFKSKDLGAPLRLISKVNSDYLPVDDKDLAYDKDFHPYGEQKRAIIENPMNEILTKKVKNNQLVFSWQSNGEKTLLPLIIYRRTSVIFNGEKITNVQEKTNKVGALLVQPKKGDNVLKVNYNSSFLFYYMFFLSILSWFIFVLWLIIKKLKA